MVLMQRHETFTAVGSTCVRTSKMKISRRLVGYVKKLQQKVCCTCNKIFSPHPTNQIIDLWRCRGRCCRHFLNFLIQVITHRRLDEKVCEMYKNEKCPVQTTVCRCQIVCKILTFLLPSSLWLLKLTGVYGKRLST